MMSQIELHAACARERRRDYLAAAERDRIANACAGGLPLSRRVARPLGRVLFDLGERLLRYGKAERAPRLYRRSARSIELN